MEKTKKAISRERRSASDFAVRKGAMKGREEKKEMRFSARRRHDAESEEKETI